MIADQSSKVVGAAVGNNGHLRHAQTPIVTAVLIGIMVLSFLVLCAWSIPYGDPIRDTNQAWLIAHGVELPLVGPPVAGVVNLGPVWWYLLAIPALFSSSMLGFSLFIGALAAAKFLLAWRLGERLVDSRTGLYLAAGLTIPSWNFWQFFFLTHAVLVEAALLGSLLLMVRYLERPTPWRAGVLGLVAGLGLHAHPTFVVAGFPLLLLWWAHGGPRKIATMHVLALVLMACVPFIPSAAGAGRHARVGGSERARARSRRSRRGASGSLALAGLWCGDDRGRCGRA
jgi:hypothetical protein